MRLSVALDHVAELRLAGGGKDPEPVAAAVVAELAGAHGLSFRLRSDRRAVQERDGYLLAEVARLPFNVEVGATPEALKVMRELKPARVTLAPEDPGLMSAGGGWNLAEHAAELAEYLALYREAGLPVALVIDPDPEAVKAAGRLAPDLVELSTREYGSAVAGARSAALRRVGDAARQAVKLKLTVVAGGGLNFQNAAALAERVPEIGEAVIGHAIVARAVLGGMDRAVRDMLALCAPAGGTR